MNHFTAIICLILITACDNPNRITRGYQAINLANTNISKAPQLVQQFAKLCLTNSQNAQTLIETAQASEWNKISKKVMEKEGLGKLEKTILKIPGGGAPIEENQDIFFKAFGENVFIIDISERFDRKKLSSTNCSLYGKQDEFLKNCASLGGLINRAPDQNTKYKDSQAHFISWNAIIFRNLAKIRCQYAPKSPTLPYEGTQLIMSIDHIHLLKSARIKKSNRQQFDVSGR